MKFHPAGAPLEDSALIKREYETARQIGTVRTGETLLFFRAGLKTYYIPYDAVRQCFRRVYQVPVKMCCGRGEIEYEHLVLCAAPTGEDSPEVPVEIADIPLPGTKAAQELIRLLKERMPEADFRSPRERCEETAGSAAAEAVPAAAE